MKLSNAPQTLLETENVLVRIMTLTPREIAPLHFYCRGFEHSACLRGALSVIAANMDTVLAPGQSTTN